MIILLSKLESIFPNINVFDKMQYEFKNRAISKLPKKFIIVVINPLIYYLIIKVSYIYLLFITKLIISDVKFKVSKETNFTNNSIVKYRRKTKPGQYIPKQSKN